MTLKRDEILAQMDIPSEEVPMPEWGGTVRVRGLSGEQRDEFDKSTMAEGPDGRLKQDATNYRAKLVVRCLVDEQNELLFDPERDVRLLASKGACAIDRLYKVCCRLSGMGVTAHEGAVKNSEAAPSDGSGTS